MKWFSFKNNCSFEKVLFARQMRKNPTPAENILWQELRNKKMGFRFKRQIVILGYIADFYCPQAGLVIECDGLCHSPSKDRVRDRVMANKGFITLRFKNEDITQNLDSVLTKIKASVCKRRRTKERIV
jgi:leucyl-tRNA synthetase